ncbi:nitroreductase family protein [Salipaludibacillus neizhouensis]|uniref:Nitroreductase family protein n=1 Tax=Salipaludibacillus neizhouensis TaxID=885475 RepID=A0A3A9JXE0_9BACI|nr:nitroreductase family protein [Salipaludibacillus neizhouensis]RKL65554.1 nitroreductase family protein [Salipaludibacillus neizhouensis]
MSTANTVTQTNDFKKIVMERRSIKSYDPSVKISREEMTEILSEATRAPSSTNLQPWHFLVIMSDESKAKLMQISAPSNSLKIETSAATIAIFGDLKNILKAEEIYNKNVELGYMLAAVKEQLLPGIRGWYDTLSEQNRRDIVMTDCGLVTMQLMLVARAHGYDTNPIAGYDKERINEVFGLDKDRYAPVMLVSIGKAADEGFPTMRLPIDRITDWE